MTTATAPPACPYCPGRMLSSRYELERTCYQCGHVDYTRPSPAKSNGLLSSATRSNVRYSGPYKEMKHLVVSVRAEQQFTGAGTGPGRIVAVPSCPWCGLEMEQRNLSGKRRHKQETRYVCTQGHRISLVEGIVSRGKKTPPTTWR